MAEHKLLTQHFDVANIETIDVYEKHGGYTAQTGRPAISARATLLAAAFGVHGETVEKSKIVPPKQKREFPSGREAAQIRRRGNGEQARMNRA